MEYQITFRPALKSGDILAPYAYSYKTVSANTKKGAIDTLKKTHPWAVIEKVEKKDKDKDENRHGEHIKGPECDSCEDVECECSRCREHQDN